VKPCWDLVVPLATTSAAEDGLQGRDLQNENKARGLHGGTHVEVPNRRKGHRPQYSRVALVGGFPGAWEYLLCRSDGTRLPASQARISAGLLEPVSTDWPYDVSFPSIPLLPPPLTIHLSQLRSVALSLKEREARRTRNYAALGLDPLGWPVLPPTSQDPTACGTNICATGLSADAAPWIPRTRLRSISPGDDSLLLTPSSMFSEPSVASEEATDLHGDITPEELSSLQASDAPGWARRNETQARLLHGLPHCLPPPHEDSTDAYWALLSFDGGRPGRWRFRAHFPSGERRPMSHSQARSGLLGRHGPLWPNHLPRPIVPQCPPPLHDVQLHDYRLSHERRSSRRHPVDITSSCPLIPPAPLQSALSPSTSGATDALAQARLQERYARALHGRSYLTDPTPGQDDEGWALFAYTGNWRGFWQFRLHFWRGSPQPVGLTSAEVRQAHATAPDWPAHKCKPAIPVTGPWLTAHDLLHQCHGRISHPTPSAAVPVASPASQIGTHQPQASTEPVLRGTVGSASRTPHHVPNAGPPCSSATPSRHQPGSVSGVTLGPTTPSVHLPTPVIAFDPSPIPICPSSLARALAHRVELQRWLGISGPLLSAEALREFQRQPGLPPEFREEAHFPAGILSPDAMIQLFAEALENPLGGVCPPICAREISLPTSLQGVPVSTLDTGPALDLPSRISRLEAQCHSLLNAQHSARVSPRGPMQTPTDVPARVPRTPRPRPQHEDHRDASSLRPAVQRVPAPSLDRPATVRPHQVSASCSTSVGTRTRALGPYPQDSASGLNPGMLLRSGRRLPALEVPPLGRLDGALPHPYARRPKERRDLSLGTVLQSSGSVGTPHPREVSPKLGSAGCTSAPPTRNPRDDNARGTEQHRRCGAVSPHPRDTHGLMRNVMPSVPTSRQERSNPIGSDRIAFWRVATPPSSSPITL